MAFNEAAYCTPRTCSTCGIHCSLKEQQVMQHHAEDPSAWLIFYNPETVYLPAGESPAILNNPARVNRVKHHKLEVMYTLACGLSTENEASLASSAHEHAQFCVICTPAGITWGLKATIVPSSAEMHTKFAWNTDMYNTLNRTACTQFLSFVASVESARF